MPNTLAWDGVTYGNGIFVAVAQITTSAASSTDGITWTLRTMPNTSSWDGVTYGNGTFVAVALNNTTLAASSTDGITWTLRTMPKALAWYGVTYGNGIFVAVASNTTSAASSTDGITWTLRTMPNVLAWYAVTYGNGTFVAVQGSGTISAASSTDGITWTLRTMPNASVWYAVTAAPFQSSINSQSIQGQTASIITTTTYTLGLYDKYIILNTTAACTLTLPNAGLYPNREITIKQIAAFAATSASSNVRPLTSNTPGTAILSGAGKFARLVSDGYFWNIVRSN